jgi:tetratricopeptide (TPR) repeat protein/transcriptional regulator with XRE-family HTH domain
MDANRSLAFGTLLRRYRLAAGLTQEDLAEQAHLSVRGLSDLERGVRRAPRMETLHLLAGALHLSTREVTLFLAAAHPPEQSSSPALERAESGPAAPTTAPETVGHGGAPAAGALAPFVGRAAELALLQRHLAGESPPVLFLAGEPGIGKTRLLQEAARSAVAHGLRVLMGGCQRQGGQQPYAPILDALDRFVQGQTPLQLRADLQDCAWLVRLLPELAEGPIAPLPVPALPSEQERRLMFGAVRRFLANVAGDAGTLLVLDDLQWAGDDALALLATLVRATGPSPLRVVGAYRDTEVHPDQPLTMLLADLAQAGLAAQHPLGPLATDEAAQLLAALLADLHGWDGVSGEDIVQRTGGVPFFLLSCAQGLRARALGAAGDPPSVGTPVPWDVAQGVRQRVAVLPTAARALLGVAAVVGRRAPLRVLAAVAGRPEEEALDALEAACHARLLVEDGEDAYRFAHDLVREVIDADLGTGRRAATHRRVAVVLEDDPATAAETLAFHYGRGGVHDAARRHLEQAGDHARAQQAHAAAERAYREALAHGAAGPPTLDVARVQEKLGAVLCSTGRYTAALPVLDAAATAYRAAGEDEALHRVTALLGRACAGRGAPAEGIARIEALLIPPQEGASPGRAALYLALVWLYVATGRLTEGVAAAEQAAALGDILGDRRILAEAHGARGGALSMQGQLEDSLRAYEQAIPAAEATGDLDTLCSALDSVAHMQMQRGVLAQARQTITRAMSVAEALGNEEGVAFETLGSCLIHYYAGDWSQARREGTWALSVSRRIGMHSSWKAAFSLFALSYVCLGEGAWDEARSYLEECVAAAEQTQSLALQRRAQAVLAEIDVQEGHPEAARVRLAPLPEHGQHETAMDTEVLWRLAWAYLELEDVARAQEVLEPTLVRLRAEQLRVALVHALGVQARLAMRQERWPEALGALDEGVSLARAIRYPYGEARHLHLMGLLHATRGQPGSARAHLREAHALFARLGARWDSARTAHLLATETVPDAVAFRAHGVP